VVRGVRRDPCDGKDDATAGETRLPRFSEFPKHQVFRRAKLPARRSEIGSRGGVRSRFFVQIKKGGENHESTRQDDTAPLSDASSNQNKTLQQDI